MIPESKYLLFSLLLVCIIGGCSQPQPLRIGVSQCSADDWRRKMNDEIMREAMFMDNVEVEIRSADDDNARQIADIRHFASEGFDIIIASPIEADAITPAIEEAYNAGIPVLVFDRKVNGEAYTAFQGADNAEIGRAAARYGRMLAGAGAKVLEIYGLEGSTPAIERHRGFAQGADSAGLHIVGIGYGKWNYDEAFSAADTLLRLRPDVDLIYAHNDRMAVAARHAANRLGLHPYVIGIDAAPEIGLKAVADSTIDATFIYPTEGGRLLRTALDIVEKRPFERINLLPVSSPVDISNADILMMQNRALGAETDKIKLLKTQVDDYWSKHSAQTSLFYALLIIVALLFGFMFLMLRGIWVRRRHQAELEEQNLLLEAERDKQASLNAQLDEATKSKLMFFTNVSHDLRTPLTLIAEPVAQLSGAANLTQSQQSLMAIADKNVKILRRLINQILDFRKYENGKLDLHLSEVDFGRAVHEWLALFEPVARRRNIKLSIEGGEAVLAIDAEKIERVFFNLVSNAFKYTPDNGHIAVRYTCTPALLTLSVTDDGRGISEDNIRNIFDRFFQVDRVQPTGSGIGLALAKAFVEQHGGTLAVRSEEGKGSEFTMEIPVQHVDRAPEATPAVMTAADVSAELAAIDTEPALDADAEKPLALVIDDNADIQKLVASLLDDQYRIITAPDGREGLRRAAKHTPDLIICDVMMPVMDGLECCRRLKAEISTSHIPVLMLTACSLDEQRVQGYQSGADGYLSKPFSADVLRARCNSLVANRKRIQELWQAKSAAPQKINTKESKSAAVHAGDIDDDFYNRFLEIFKEEMGNPDLNVDSLASKMGLGRSQFYRKIKALTNYSPVELVRNLRLRRARTLLITTNLSVSEIAYGVGFSTPAYFTKCYREAFGETPTALRDNLGM